MNFNKTNNIIRLALICSSIFVLSCGESSNKSKLKNSKEFNIIASVKNPVAIISVDLMELFNKSNIKNSKEIPPQFKMMLNPQLDQYLNSENQGFKVEGNLPIIVSSTDDNKLDYIMSFTDVLDAEKIKSSLSLYIGEDVNKTDDIYSMDFSTSGIRGTFAWDNEKLIAILSEKNENTKEIAFKMLSNRLVDAPNNEDIKQFLAEDNDFSSLFFIDKYNKLVNQFSEVTIDKELAESYNGMTMFSKGNFSKGSFTITTKINGEKFKESKFNNIKDTPVSKDFSNYITDNGKLIAYGGASINIDALINIINSTKTEYSSYTNELENIGLKKEDISSIFDGDFVFSFIDVESIPNEDYKNNPAYNQIRPKILVTCGIKDTSKLKSILDSNKSTIAIGNYYSVEDVYFGINNNKLFVSLNDSLIKNLSNGQKMPEFNNAFPNPIYGFINSDVNSLPTSFKNIILSQSGEKIFNIYNQIKLIEFGGDFNNSVFKLELNDNSKNSLEIIMDNIIKESVPMIVG